MAKKRRLHLRNTCVAKVDRRNERKEENHRQRDKKITQ